MNRVIIRTEQLEEIFGYACRYCLGRKSYAPHSFIDCVTEMLPYISEGCIKNLIRDINEAEDSMNLGDRVIDKPKWIDFRRKLIRELNYRERNK